MTYGAAQQLHSHFVLAELGVPPRSLARQSQNHFNMKFLFVSLGAILTSTHLFYQYVP